MEHQLNRRVFLKTACATTAAVTVGAGSASAGHSVRPTMTFPDGTALVLEQTQGPMNGAVRTRRVYMPDGGWVVISTDEGATNIIGRSAQRLPAGHFESLLVNTQSQEPGAYTLYATLFKGASGATFPGEGASGYGLTQDSAEITFE